MLPVDTLKTLRSRAINGLTETLDFFNDYAKDPTGGFYGSVDRDLVPNKTSARSLLLNARILWTYANAYRMLRERRYLDIAMHVYRYIKEHFIDPEFGGAYWRVKADGTLDDDRKLTYGQAFVIYGASELYRACTLCGDPAIKSIGDEAKQLAIDIYNLCERYMLDQFNGGYFESYDRRWNRRIDILNNIWPPPLGSKGLNTHLHIIEAYTNLMRVWKDPDLHAKIGTLIDIMNYKLLDRNIFHYKPYVMDDWQSTLKLVSLGHDIEGSWLLTEAAHEFGGKAIIEDCDAISVRIADACYERGIDLKTGGMRYEYHIETGEYEQMMVWWAQCEAVIGFFNAYQLTGQQMYLDCTLGVWDYIDHCVIDRSGGIFREWLTDAAQPADSPVNRYVANEWKCSYHNGRMYMELIERIDKMLATEIRFSGQ